MPLARLISSGTRLISRAEVVGPEGFEQRRDVPARSVSLRSTSLCGLRLAYFRSRVSPLSLTVARTRFAVLAGWFARSGLAGI